MTKKFDCDNLYVACPIFEDEYEEEPWVQYESMGSVRHTIYVNPKKILIYSITDNDGNRKYYNYKTGEEVTEKSFKRSFFTKSSPAMNLYSGYIHGEFPIHIAGIRDEIKERYNLKNKEVGYFIPFNEYMEEKLGINCSNISLSTASALVKLTNIGCGKTFYLSQDETKAAEQLKHIGYHVKSNKAKIKK